MAMIAKLLHIMRALPMPGRWRPWLLAALAMKLSYFAISLQQPDAAYPGSFARCNAECPSYTWPMDSLVESGAYAPDFRMPGYAVHYLPLRLILPKPMAMNAVVVAQMMLDVLATVALAMGAYLLTGSRAVHLIIFLLYGLAPTVSGFSIFAMSESPCASAMALSFYAGARYERSGDPRLLLLASALMTWAYFLRPVAAVFLMMGGLALVPLMLRQGRRSAWHLVVAAAPVVLAQGAWTYRNAQKTGRLFLFTRSTYHEMYNSTTLAMWRFVGTFDDKTAYYGFYCADYAAPWRIKGDPEREFPDWIFTEAFNADSLQELRKLCPLLLADTVAAAERDRIDAQLAERFTRYADSIREEHPWRVRIVTPARRVAQQLIGSSGVLHLFRATFSSLAPWEKAVKLGGALVYKLALLGALFFIPWAFYRRTWPGILLAVAMAYALVIHAGIMGFGDVRYLYVFYPLMCLCAGLVFGGWLNSRRSSPAA